MLLRLQQIILRLQQIKSDSKILHITHEQGLYHTVHVAGVAEVSQPDLPSVGLALERHVGGHRGWA